ncbi:MAG: hypothetical protein ABR549_08925, partial [Mycobacteriales bacterium]
MASRTPWFTTCATAAVSGLLVLATGTASTPMASPLPVPAVAGAAGSHPAAGSHAKAATAGSQATTAATRSAAKANPAAAAHTPAQVAAQRVRLAGLSGLSGGTSDETLVGRTTGAAGVDHVLMLRQSSLASLRRKKVPVPTPTASAAPTPTATGSAAPVATSNPTPTSAPAATPTASATAAPSPVV